MFEKIQPFTVLLKIVFPFISYRQISFNSLDNFEMPQLTHEERTRILMLRGEGNMIRPLNEVRRMFNEQYRQNGTPISVSTVSRTISHFENHRTVANLPKTGRPPTATNDEIQIDVAQDIVENPRLSCKEVAAMNNISKTSAWRILKKKLKFHPYKVHIVHELLFGDAERRIVFCETMMQRINNDPHYLRNIVFSDEATFQLNGNVNSQNCRYWCDENPYEFHEGHTQYPQKVNVWAGIRNGTIIGPFRIDGNLNGPNYLDMLRNTIIPALQQATGENFNNIQFQQDGAPPHWTVPVREYLNEVFPNRWIGRDGPTPWPARSPDLTPLDFFLWGYLKSKVYATPPQNLDDLWNRIQQQAALIDEEMIKKAVDSFEMRIAYCQIVNGTQFEHKI